MTLPHIHAHMRPLWHVAREGPLSRSITTDMRRVSEGKQMRNDAVTYPCANEAAVARSKGGPTVA